MVPGRLELLAAADAVSVALTCSLCVANLSASSGAFLALGGLP